MHAELNQLLIDKGLISKRQLDEARKSLKNNSDSIGRCLIKMGYITQENLARFVAKQFNLPFVHLDELEINQQAIKLISCELAEKFSLIPIFKTDRDISIAFSDPTDTFIINTIEFMTGLCVIPFAANESDIKKAIAHHYFLPGKFAEQG